MFSLTIADLRTVLLLLSSFVRELSPPDDELELVSSFSCSSKLNQFKSIWLKVTLYFGPSFGTFFTLWAWFGFLMGLLSVSTKVLSRLRFVAWTTFERLLYASLWNVSILTLNKNKISYFMALLTCLVDFTFLGWINFRSFFGLFFLSVLRTCVSLSLRALFGDIGLDFVILGFLRILFLMLGFTLLKFNRCGWDWCMPNL